MEELRQLADRIREHVAHWEKPRVSMAVGLREQQLSPEAATQFRRLLAEALAPRPEKPDGHAGSRRLLARLDRDGSGGQARGMGIEPCPELDEGPGALVTGWFQHWRGRLYDLRVTGEPDAIGVADRHPFWSVNRNGWVAAIELRRGERLLALDGSMPVVESFTLRENEEPVYNIEVDGDHCYRVGEEGLLVHNASIGYPWTHTDGETEQERIDGNKCNVAAYVVAVSTPILQIAAGPNTYADALPEDILVWNGNTRLWVKQTETDLQVFTAGKTFSSVIVINSRNPTPGGDYLWVFDVAKSAIASGAIVVVAGAPNQPGYHWIKKHIADIENHGFEFLDEGPAPANIAAMPVAGVNPVTGQITTQPSQPTAVQMRFKKK